MTDPLPIEQPCGCPVGQGHYCPPPWVDAEEWAAAHDEFNRMAES